MDTAVHETERNAPSFLGSQQGIQFKRRVIYELYTNVACLFITMLIYIFLTFK